MDTIFAHAVIKILEMPQESQRAIGEALLIGAVEPDLPVIEFTAEDRKHPVLGLLAQRSLK